MRNTAFHGVKVNTADRFSLAIREKIRETVRVVPHSRRKPPITGEIFKNCPKISFFPALRETPPSFQSSARLAGSRTGGEGQRAPQQLILYTVCIIRLPVRAAFECQFAKERQTKGASIASGESSPLYNRPDHYQLFRSSMACLCANSFSRCACAAGSDM